MTVQSAYDEWSEQYDHNLNKTRDLDAVATRQTLGGYSFSTVVELGCGTGKNTGFYLSRADKIIGIDFSEKMLAKAKQKYSDSRIEFRMVDLTNDWGQPAESAGLVTCNLVLEHIDDLPGVFNQAHTILQQDGMFFISELHPFRQYLGSKAKFENSDGIQELESYVHHVSDYLSAAMITGFELINFKEWFDESDENHVPRLIGILLRKTDAGIKHHG